MNGIGYIYKITNTSNGKIYIGKTKYTIQHRWLGHIRSSNICKEIEKTSSKLYNAINKYGIESFTIEEIEQCSYDELNERERYWIKELDSRNPNVGYNICVGGEGGPGGPMFAGHKHSEKTKQKMSADRSGENNANYGNHWHHTPDMNYRYDGENNPMYGKKQSEETKMLISQKNKGKIFVTNGEEDIKINPEELDLYIMAGYRRGRTFARGQK